MKSFVAANSISVVLPCGRKRTMVRKKKRWQSTKCYADITCCAVASALC